MAHTNTADMSALLAAGGMAFNVKNTAYGGGAAGNGSTDDTAAIQAALAAASNAGGGTVAVPAGNYKLTSALTPGSGTRIIGAGRDVATFTQTSTTANAVTCLDVNDVTIDNITINGPAAGSGYGIRLNCSANANVNGIILRNIKVNAFGGHCVYGTVVITSLFEQVDVGGYYLADAFHFDGSVNTSLTFNSCYANGTAHPGNGTGYTLVNGVYCSFNGCATDRNYWGYELTGCQGVSLNGCGAEHQSNNSFELEGGSGNVINGAWVYGNGAAAVHVTSGETNATLTGIVENTPAAGATACIKTEPGTSAVVINVHNSTANSYAPGTAYVITPTGAAAH